MTDPFITEPNYLSVEAWWENKITESTAILDSNNITSLWWQYQQGTDAIVQDAEELNQAVTVILGTPQRTDFHRPDFASNIINFVDYPINQAIPYVVRESADAIEEYEPRLELTSLDITAQAATGRLTVVAGWEVIDTDVDGETTVSLGTSDG